MRKRPGMTLDVQRIDEADRAHEPGEHVPAELCDLGDEELDALYLGWAWRVAWLRRPRYWAHEESTPHRRGQR